MYQTKSNEPNFFLGDQTKSIDPNLPNQTYNTESTKSNLPTKYTIPNLCNQTYKTKSIQLLLSNQIYRRLKLSLIPAWAELGQAQLKLELDLTLTVCRFGL